MSAHTVPVRTDHPAARNALSPSAAKLYERQSALFGARMRGPRLILPAEPFWAHSFLRSFIEKLFQRSTLQISPMNSTLWCIRSVVMFCLVFFRKFWLPNSQHSSCNNSPTAGGTCQKCSTKYHDRVDAPQCRLRLHFFRMDLMDVSIGRISKKKVNGVSLKDQG